MKSIRIVLRTLLPLVLIFSLLLPTWTAQASVAPASTLDAQSATGTAKGNIDQPCGPCSGTASQAEEDTGLATTLSEGESTAQPLKVNIQVDLALESDALHIDAILNAIEERDWRTTVFVTGEFASAYPQVVADIQDRGHEIGVNGWERGENLALLSYEEQLELIQKAFSAVRGAVNRPEEVVDFKPQGYAFNVDTFEALQDFGARSISGTFTIDDYKAFSWCPYVQSLGKVTFPYPITDRFWAVPISTIEIDSQDTPLDDGYIDDPQIFLDSLIAGYGKHAETRDPLVTVVHPSITATDAVRLEAFSQFLDYLGGNGGHVKPLSPITHLTEFIPSLEITSAPESASAGETISVTARFRAAIYCPSYYFRIYGKYSGDTKWTLHATHYHGVSTGTFSLSKSFTIPEPPTLLPTEDAFVYEGEYRLNQDELRDEEKKAIPYVMKYGEQYRVSPSLIMAVIRQESAFDADANGNAWVGYMQVSQEVAKRFGYAGNESEWCQKDGLDPDQNIRYGTKYLSTLNDIFKEGKHSQET